MTEPESVLYRRCRKHLTPGPPSRGAQLLELLGCESGRCHGSRDADLLTANLDSLNGCRRGTGGRDPPTRPTGVLNHLSDRKGPSLCQRKMNLYNSARQGVTRNQIRIRKGQER